MLSTSRSKTVKHFSVIYSLNSVCRYFVSSWSMFLSILIFVEFGRIVNIAYSVDFCHVGRFSRLSHFSQLLRFRQSC